MIYIDKDKDIPIYQQIYEAIVSDITTGALKAGDNLTPTRKLAEDLSVGRNTVNKAYQQLIAEGYVQSIQGSGIKINKIPEAFIGAPRENNKVKAKVVHDDFEYDFAYGSMDINVFPFNVWRKCMNKAIDTMMMGDNLVYPVRIGDISLRQALTSYLQRVRGVIATPEQVIITSGMQYNLEILSKMFDNTSKRFAMENPGYDGVRPMFANRGYEIIPIPVGENGISLEALKNKDIDIMHITPSHQFPTGAVLPIGERLKLLKWAEETNTYIIEDDYDSELRYYTNPIPSLQSLDTSGKIIYTGTFSKAFAPITRTAYMVLPLSLLDRFREVWGRYNSQVPLMHQLALADYIESGEHEKNVNRLKTIYKKKESYFRNLVEELFGDSVELEGGDAGIHFLMNVKTDLTDSELIERASSIGVKMYSSQIYYLNDENLSNINLSDKKFPQLVVGLPTVPEDALRSILIKLREVWGL